MRGGDPRPLLETPQPFYPIPAGLTIDSYYDPPSDAELGAHVVEMVDYLVSQPSASPAQVGLIYAWNELAEGGWLMPTFTTAGPDLGRAAAIGAALAAAIRRSTIPQLDLVN